MQTFFINAHIHFDNQYVVQYQTTCYAPTLQEACTNFCMLLREKQMEPEKLHFYICEIRRTSQEGSFTPVGLTHDVVVRTLTPLNMTMQSGEEYA